MNLLQPLLVFAQGGLRKFTEDVIYDILTFIPRIVTNCLSYKTTHANVYGMYRIVLLL